MSRLRLLVGDVREQLGELADGSVQTVVTSPPYWGLRDYGADGQIGLEPTPGAFVAELVDVFREVRRVLRDDGTAWVNLGDTYLGGRSGRSGTSAIVSSRNHDAANAAWRAQGGGTHRTAPGLKPKDLVGIPWRVALALQEDGWWLRSEVIWHKPNPQPENVRDRPGRAHEHVFLLAKSRRYYYDADAIRTPLKPKTLTTYGSRRRSKGTDALGRVRADRISRDLPERRPRVGDDGAPAGANKRTVWTVAQTPFLGAHFATFPPALVEPCILAGAPPGGVVLDPFAGSGTTLQVALELGRRAVGIEINPEYAAMARERCRGVQVPLIAPGLASAGAAVEAEHVPSPSDVNVSTATCGSDAQKAPAGASDN